MNDINKLVKRLRDEFEDYCLHSTEVFSTDQIENITGKSAKIHIMANFLDIIENLNLEVTDNSYMVCYLLEHTNVTLSYLYDVWCNNEDTSMRENLREILLNLVLPFH